jgi:transcriptional regulator with XRE-family HTH domain
VIADIGRTIRETRQRLRWSQGALADKAGVNVETVCRAEKGETVKRETLDKIRAALQLDSETPGLRCSWCKGTRGPMICNDDMTIFECGPCARKHADFLDPQ